MEHNSSALPNTKQVAKRPSGRDCLKQESHQPEEFINEIPDEPASDHPARL
jgi:hypothetical protein